MFYYSKNKEHAPMTSHPLQLWAESLMYLSWAKIKYVASEYSSNQIFDACSFVLDSIIMADNILK